MLAVCEQNVYSILHPALSMIGRRFAMPSLIGGSQGQVSDSPTRVQSSEKGMGAGAGYWQGEEQDRNLIPTEPAKPEAVTRSQR